MAVTVRATGPEILPVYSEIDMRFAVESVLRIDPIDGGLGGMRMVEEPVEAYVKDYDGIVDGEGGPTHWATRWDISNWGIFVAEDDGRLVGGATVAWNTEGVDMLEGRADIACLWDLRVAPEHRGRGLGRRLFAAAVEFARGKGCTQLKIETQNINVAACRFYARQGARLGCIHRFGYAGCAPVAHEALLLWYVELR